MPVWARYYHQNIYSTEWKCFSTNGVCNVVGNTDDQSVNQDAFSITNCNTDMKQTNKQKKVPWLRISELGQDIHSWGG